MFPNAAKGVKRIFTSEILSLIAVGVSIISGILGLAAIGAATVDSETGAFAALGGAGVVALISGILLIIAFIMQLVGLVNASKDEPAFKISLYAVIAGIVLSFLSSIFSKNAVLTGIFNTLSTVAQLIVTLFVIFGIINLANKMGNKDVADRGNSLIKVIACVYIIAAIVILVSALLGATVVASILSIAGNVLMIVAYIVFVILLAQAKKMLEAK